MQFDLENWSLPIEFECMKTVWPFIKISSWPFLRNTIDMSIINLQEQSAIGWLF